MSPYLFFLHSDCVTSQMTLQESFLGHQRFSSITSDQIDIESRKGTVVLSLRFGIDFGYSGIAEKKSEYERLAIRPGDAFATIKASQPLEDRFTSCLFFYRVLSSLLPGIGLLPMYVDDH